MTISASRTDFVFSYYWLDVNCVCVLLAANSGTIKRLWNTYTKRYEPFAFCCVCFIISVNYLYCIL